MENVWQTLANGAVLGANYKTEKFFRPEFENASKLNLTISAQIREQFVDLSTWEKLFVVNFYGKNDNGIVLEKPNNKETKIFEIKQDINFELERLYNIAENSNFFEIETKNNQFLEREFQNEVNALKARGEEFEVKLSLDNKENTLISLAKKYSISQREEYKHVVNLVKGLNFEPAFKALMLRETLLHCYKQTFGNGKPKTIVEKRIPNKTLTGHMTLDEEVLNYINKNIENYSNFSSLYFDGVACAKKIITEKSEISLESVNTFGMGKWIQFEGKTSNEKEYLNNATKLSALVQNTPWCTKQLAASQLENGDFFVFVDNLNAPHIAVKMQGNSIGEVRGIKGGSAQEIEEEYRPVAIEFLEKNKNIKNGKEWLEKEEWNKRLIGWKNEIENGTFKNENVLNCLKDLTNEDYKCHSGFKNSNLTNLVGVLPKAKASFGETLGCKDENIFFGDYDFVGNYEVCSFEAIVGNAKFFTCAAKDVGNLKYVFGDADFSGSQIKDLKSLEKIWGSANFSCSNVKNLGALKEIGKNAYFGASKITNLNELETVGGNLYLVNSKVESAPNLNFVGGEIYLNPKDKSNSQIYEQLSKIKDVKQISNKLNSKKISKINSKKQFKNENLKAKNNILLKNKDLFLNFNENMELNSKNSISVEKEDILMEFKEKNNQFNF